MTALPAATVRVPASELRPGDVIHPPKRELSLWMLRTAKDEGKPSEWLTLVVSHVEPSSRPGFALVVAHHTDTQSHPWRFLAKATTVWPVVSRAQEVARG